MNKTLLIGWDAADWKVIHPLMEAGEMPNLERFVAQGAMGNLCTLQPILSPMLWTSIATGKRAHKHGIHGFSEPDPSSGGARPVTNLGRKVRAIWNMLQLHGLRSNVVGWWPSFPPEPISGVMVSNHFHTAPKNHQAPWPVPVKQVHPERLAGPLAEFRVRPEQLTAEQLLPFVPRAAEIDQYKDKRLFAVAKILAETATVHGAATALMQLEPWDFMAVYFDAIDHFGHGFMKYHPPRQAWIGEADYALYKDVVAGGYRFHDMMLGTSMELAGPDTNILICSDHGFHPDHLRPREIPNEPAGPAAEHRHQDAERVFQEILGIDPVNAQAQSGLAQSYLGRRGLEEPALAALGASLALVFHNPRGHYLRGAVLMRLKRFDEAIAAFETAVAQNSVYPAAHRRLAQLLPRIGAGLKYRIVFLERPLNEVIASQRAMLARTGKEGGRLTDRRLAQAYLKQLASVRAVLKRYPERVALLSVNYHEALAAPAGTAARVHAFLGGGLDESAMAAAIDPTLRRQGSATSEAA